MKTPIDFGSKIILKLTDAEPEPEPVPELVPAVPRKGPIRTKVTLTTRVLPATYLALKQVSWWVPGTVEETFIDEAIREKIARTPGADQALPADELARVRQQKKFGGPG